MLIVMLFVTNRSPSLPSLPLFTWACANGLGVRRNRRTSGRRRAYGVYRHFAIRVFMGMCGLHQPVWVPCRLRQGGPAGVRCCCMSLLSSARTWLTSDFRNMLGLRKRLIKRFFSGWELWRGERGTRTDQPDAGCREGCRGEVEAQRAATFAHRLAGGQDQECERGGHGSGEQPEHPIQRVSGPL